MNLGSPISDLPKVGPFFATKFEKLGIATIEDLFFHVPSRYMDYSLVTTIKKLRAGETATIHASIVLVLRIMKFWMMKTKKRFIRAGLFPYTQKPWGFLPNG